MNKAFYYTNFKGRERENENGETEDIIGLRGYWQNYKKASIDAIINKNGRICTLADLTMESDTVAMLTDCYEFKLVKKY